MAKKQKTEVTTIVPASELETIKRSCSGVIVTATALKVQNPTSENDAYTILKQIAAKKKEVEKRRTEITKPLNTSLKATNALFKEVTDPLIEADGILRDKILAFQSIQREKADKERERREKIQDAHEAAGHEIHELAEVEPDVGISTMTKRWTYEVTDVTKIPRNYLVPHPVAIRAAITQGERDIPGLSIFQVGGLRV